MTMSTYKSFGGPAGGLSLSNDAGIAEKLDTIAFPGVTANFDTAKSAVLAETMLDWRDHGKAYATEMTALSKSLSDALDMGGISVFSGIRGFTNSQQFAIMGAPFGGGQTASKTLREGVFWDHLSRGI